MATLTLRPDLVRRVQEIAEQEHRSVEEVLENMITHYQPAASPDQPENGLLKALEMIDSDDTVVWSGPADLSERTKEILETEYTDYLMKRMARPADDTDTDR